MLQFIYVIFFYFFRKLILFYFYMEKGLKCHSNYLNWYKIIRHLSLDPQIFSMSILCLTDHIYN